MISLYYIDIDRYDLIIYIDRYDRYDLIILDIDI